MAGTGEKTVSERRGKTLGMLHIDTLNLVLITYQYYIIISESMLVGAMEKVTYMHTQFGADL
ncbi:hypothetical protein CMT77_05805 [Elizabethkingia anophelis]|nr:hypothetical protein [Elizabethkingia anophelis]